MMVGSWGGEGGREGEREGRVTGGRVKKVWSAWSEAREEEGARREGGGREGGREGEREGGR
jgi:hypothetical protein